MTDVVDFRKLVNRPHGDGIAYFDHDNVVTFISVGRRGWFFEPKSTRPAFQIWDGEIRYADGWHAAGR